MPRSASLVGVKGLCKGINITIPFFTDGETEAGETAIQETTINITKMTGWDFVILEIL